MRQLLAREVDEGDDPRLFEFLELSVGRVLMNGVRKGEAWLVDDDSIGHIADWLKVDILADRSWIANVDAEGRPKKLMKFSSLEGIVREADKAMNKRLQGYLKVALGPQDEQPVANLRDGWMVFHLLSPKSLDRESGFMRHCIGNGAYDDLLENDDYRFLSLRAPNGKPCVTIEVSHKEVVQVQGPRNERPPIELLRMLAPFFAASGFKAKPLRTLHVEDMAGRWHCVHELPIGVRLKGDVDLCGTKVTSLPEGLFVQGRLDISGLPELTTLPDGLHVGGTLWHHGSGVAAIPDGTIIGGDLVCGRNIKRIGNGVRVGEEIDLTHCAGVELGEGISVGHLTGLRMGRLDRKFKPFPILGLPRDFEIAEWLDLSDSDFCTILPEGLKCGDLRLSGSSITTLSKGTVVHGSAELYLSKVSDLPEGLRVDGDLLLRGSNVVSLPRGLHVGGMLWVTPDQIATFPEGIHVGKELRVDGSWRGDLPVGIADGVLVTTADFRTTAGAYRSGSMLPPVHPWREQGPFEDGFGSAMRRAETKRGPEGPL